jgi:hypothetical protein
MYWSLSGGVNKDFVTETLLQASLNGLVATGNLGQAGGLENVPLWNARQAPFLPGFFLT